MKRKFKTGNVLLLTSIFLVALSIFAGGISMSIVYSSTNFNNLNKAFNAKSDVKDELYSTYDLLLSGQSFPSESDSIHNKISSLDLNATYKYQKDNVDIQFVLLSNEFNEKEYQISIKKEKNSLICPLFYDGTYTLGDINIL